MVKRISETSRYYGDVTIIAQDDVSRQLYVNAEFSHDHVWQRDGDEANCDLCNAEWLR